MPRDDRFRTTKWSVILTARARDEPGSDEALARLCEIYWYPLYVFVRRRGYDPDAALDLTQGYFLRLLERDYLEDVQPEAGKFRSFLLVSMKHYLANEKRRVGARKRGGDRQLVSLDAGVAEDRYRLEPPHDQTPERAYERRWALTVIEQARRRLARELDEAGKSEHYALLSGYLTGDDPDRSYREVAERLQTTEAAIKMAVLRLRRRYGRLLRAEIAQTVDDDAAVDAEVRHLLAAVLRR